MCIVSVLLFLINEVKKDKEAKGQVHCGEGKRELLNEGKIDRKRKVLV